MRKRFAGLRTRLERLLLWRVWERMLEIEFVDRSVALAGKAFVSFFPLVIVVAAFVPERIRSSIITSNEAQFGFFGVALSLVTWFSGAAICILIGACAGPVLAEDTGQVGSLIRGGESGTLTAGARPSLPPPARDLGLRDAFRSTEDS